MKTILSIILTLGLSARVFAGTDAGNGDYCEQNGASCNRVYFRLSTSHPQGEKLLNLIRAADLPHYLKNQIIRDFEMTRVIYSNERIKLSELISRYEMQLESKRVETIKDRNGNVTSRKEIEKWNRVEVLPNLGIFVASTDPGYKAGNLENIYLRALTETFKDRVIYFTPFLKEMNADEQMRLVLHEQAWRLPALAEFQDDERSVEGWATELWRYLNGKVSKEQFYQTLRALNIPIADKLSLPNLHRVDFNKLEADINIIINGDDVRNTGTSGNDFLIELDPAVFKDYPALQKSPVLSINAQENEAMKTLEEYFTKLTTSHATTTLEIKVKATRQTNNVNNQTLVNQDHIDRLELVSTAAQELSDEVNTIFRSHYKYENTDNFQRIVNIPLVLPSWYGFINNFSQKANVLTSQLRRFVMIREKTESLLNLQSCRSFRLSRIYLNYKTEKGTFIHRTDPGFNDDSLELAINFSTLPLSDENNTISEQMLNEYRGSDYGDDKISKSPVKIIFSNENEDIAPIKQIWDYSLLSQLACISASTGMTYDSRVDFEYGLSSSEDLYIQVRSLGDALYTIVVNIPPKMSIEKTSAVSKAISSSLSNLKTVAGESSSFAVKYPSKFQWNEKTQSLDVVEYSLSNFSSDKTNSGKRIEDYVKNCFPSEPIKSKGFSFPWSH
jgi:hypothetical protein